MMLVEFIEGRDFLTALVLEAKSHRLSVLAESGREMTISQSRLLPSTQEEVADPGDRSGRVALLKRHGERRRGLAVLLDLEELWEILAGEGPEFSYQFLAELQFGGRSRAEEVSALIRAIFHDGLRFKFTPEAAHRHTAEEIAALSEKRRQFEEIEAREESLAGWLAALKAGTVAPDPPEYFEEAKDRLIEYAVFGEEAHHKKEVQAWLKRAGLSPAPALVFDLLVLLGEFNRHENLLLRSLDRPLDFSPEVTAEAVRLTASGFDSAEKRLDLTGLNTLTIDASGARDLDDAISVKTLAGGRWQVAVHITDAASLIPPDSLLDLEARLRASSIYLPDAKYPMLPVALSEGLLSLTLGDVRPAFSFLLTLEADGRITESELTPSLIRVDRQLSFNEVDQNLNDDSDLVDLWDMAQALIARREAQGGANLNLPKLAVYFNPDGKLTTSLTRWDTPAKIIVSELMILANYLAAETLRGNGFPCPYRYQESTRSALDAEPAPAEGDSEDIVLARSLAARRRGGPSNLSFEPVPHHGLGLPVYTAFTAPMRRYLDLLVARQLRSLSRGEEPAYGEREFQILARPAYDLSQRIQRMQTKRQRYWLIQFLADKVGSEFSALVFERRGRRLRVCLVDYMLEFDLYWPPTAGPVPSLWGQNVKVRLTRAEAREDILKFDWV